jgi:DNA-binding XRE family transcriptional regulator
VIVRLKEVARERKNLSLYKLAQVMDLPQQSVYSWASGRTQPNWESIELLCTILECRIDDMFQPEPRTEYSKEQLVWRKEKELQQKYRRYKELKAELEASDVH